MPIFRNTRWRVLPALVITTLVVGSLSTTAIAFAVYQSSPSTYNGRCHQQRNCHRPTTTVRPRLLRAPRPATTSTPGPPPRQAPQGDHHYDDGSTTSTTVAPHDHHRTLRAWWVPGTGAIEWQWELDHALSLSSATDMGYNDKTYTGAAAPDPTVYDIDGIDNPASTVSALHALGDKVVCYIETGDAGNYYSASEEGIATSYYAQFSAAGDLGSKQSGYPEYYLNINAPSTLAIIEAMIKQQCSAKGFDAVETDNDETWQYSTGFSITEANDEAYMTSVANYIHSLGHGMVHQELRRRGGHELLQCHVPLG